MSLKLGKQVGVAGRGTFGEARIHEKLDSKEKVVIKGLPMFDLSPEEREVIKVEAEQLLRIPAHPLILGFHRIIINENIAVYVSDFAEGGTLEDAIKSRQGRHFASGKALVYMTQLVCGLDYLHVLGILHGDLKPRNCLFNGDRTFLRLADMDSGKCILAARQFRKDPKQFPSPMSPHYLAPELIDLRPYTKKSDMWSLGCVIYELNMLYRAFEAEDPYSIILKIEEVEYVPMDERTSPIARAIVKLLLINHDGHRASTKDLIDLLSLHGDQQQLHQLLPNTDSKTLELDAVNDMEH